MSGAAPMSARRPSSDRRILRGMTAIRPGPVSFEQPRAGGDFIAARAIATSRGVKDQALDPASSIVRLSGVEIDIEHRTVRRPDGTQTLSPSEVALLQALLSARGRACTPAELVSRIWGKQSASAVHYLRLYIRYLRQKIELDPLHPRHIFNVRGAGYRLAVPEHALVLAGR